MSALSPPVVPARRPAVRERLLVPYVALLAAGAVTGALLGGVDAIAAAPLVFAALAAGFLVAQRVEVPLPGGGHTSPATIPAITLAIVCGPAGVVLGEALLAVKLLADRRPPVRVLFDFGAAGLAGVAAAALATLLPGDGDGLVLTGLLIGAVYFAVNNLFLIGVWCLHEGGNAIAHFRERVAGSTVYELAYGTFAGLLVLGGQRLGAMVALLVGVPLLTVWLGHRQSLARSAEHVRELEAANDRLRLMMLQTVESLARTIEARDPHTGGHTERVGDFALAVARRLPFRDEELRALAAGAVIHDVGKIGIPDAILLKEGPLDEAEWAWMRRHPEIGAYILGGLDIPELAKHVARHHHERFDGGGYPDGLAGEDIPLAARVLTVADALDAMTSDRPYRRALPVDTALAEVRAKAGSQFCPTVVQALLAAHEAGELDLTSGGTP